MKKTLLWILCIGLLLSCGLFLCACGGDEDSVSSELSNEPSESTKEIDPIDALLACKEQTENASSFVTSLEGSCETQVLLFTYRQEMRSERVVSGAEVFSQSVSTSTLVQVGVQQYFNGDAIVIRGGNVHSMDQVEWDETATSVTEAAFRDAYGMKPNGLSGYVIDRSTIRSAYLAERTENTYRFVYEMDPHLATAEYAKQVQTMGDLSRLPEFQSVRMTVEMDLSFRPISVQYEETYSISIAILGETTCRAKYTETFSDWNKPVQIPQSSFFSSYLQAKPVAALPSVSSGYSLLHAVLGNDSSYTVTLETNARSEQFYLTLDGRSGSIALQNEQTGFLYAKNRYYLYTGNERYSADATALNSHILPLTSLLSHLMSDSDQSTSVSSLFSDLRVVTQNGKMILSASQDGLSFSAILSLGDFSLEELDCTLTLSGIPCQIRAKKAAELIPLPDLQTFSDITPSLVALTFFDSLSSEKDLAYLLDISGETSLSADLTLSTGDVLCVSLKSRSGNVPLSVYCDSKQLLARLGDATVTGSVADASDLLSLFRSGQTGSTSQSGFSFPKIRTERNSISLLFGENDAAVLTVTASDLTFSSGAQRVRLTLRGESATKAVPPSRTKYTLTLSGLHTFLKNSIYPDLAGSKTIQCIADLQTSQLKTKLTTRMTLSPRLAVSMTADQNGDKTALMYEDGTFYLYHPAVRAYVSADKVSDVWKNVSGLFGSGTGASFDGGLGMLQELSCTSDRLFLRFEHATIECLQDSITVTFSDGSLKIDQFSMSAKPSGIVMPDRDTCIDALALSNRFSALSKGQKLSFSGEFQGKKLQATVSRLDLQYQNGFASPKLACNFTMKGTGSPYTYSLVYDGEAIYLDAAGNKLFCPASVLDQLLSLPGASPLGASGGLPISTLRNVSFTNDVLTIETNDRVIKLIWEQNDLSRILMTSADGTLSLQPSLFTPIKAPDLNGYADITPIGELLQAVLGTAQSGSLSLNGKMELQALSKTLTDIRVSGDVSIQDGNMTGAVTVQVPYLFGVTSKGIPLASDFKVLKSADIRTELYFVGGKLYLKRTTTAKYELFSQITKTDVQKRVVDASELFVSLPDILSFVLNLESTASDGMGSAVKPDPAQKDLLKRFSHSANVYTLEWNPDALLPAAKEILLQFTTSDTKISEVKATVSFPAIRLVANCSLQSFGKADVRSKLPKDFSGYTPLRTSA